MFFWRAMLLLLALPLLAAGEERKAPPDSGEGSCLTSGCHADLAERPMVHGAVEGEMCEACHEYAGEGHAFQLLAEPVSEMCTTCHEDPTEAGEHVHPPVSEGECTVCHDPHGSEAESLLTSAPEEICLGCHDVPESTEGVVHPPVEEAQCLMCHSPHASEHPFLTRESGKDLCLGCHEVTDETVSQAQLHGIINTLGCAACHHPHAGPAPAMLHARGNDLCMECHRAPEVVARPPVKETETEKGRKKKRGRKKDKEKTVEPVKEAQEEVPKEVNLFGRRAVDSAVFKAYPKIPLEDGRGHPMTGHPVSAEKDPRNPEETFGCKSCHDPHGSRVPGLLIGGSKMRLCGQCHKK